MEARISELKKYISEKYRFRTELHAHTSPVSSCADFPPEEVIRRYAAIGYDAIAVTNHFTYGYRFERFDKEPSAEEFVNWYMTDFYAAKKAGERYGITVILGAELRFAENQNDYLAYGIDEDTLIEIYDRLPYGLADFRNSERLKNILLVQAHRFRNNMEYADPSLLDGIETFNMHNGHNSRIGKTVKFAKDEGFKIVTAGSDFHHDGGEGMAALRTAELPDDSYRLADILRGGDYAFEIAENSIILP